MTSRARYDATTVAAAILAVTPFMLILAFVDARAERPDFAPDPTFAVVVEPPLPATAPTVARPAQPRVHHGVRAGQAGDDTVRFVQAKLVGYGYRLEVDGWAGPQTARAVRHWQRANGLVVDGVIGEQTIASFNVAVAGEPATRVGNPGGLRGMPFPPDGLAGCDRMSWFRSQAGLPAEFDQIGWRESRCDNTQVSGTGCCYGWFQNYFASHMSPQSRYRPFIIDHCHVDTVDDIYGTSDLAAQKQACVTAVVFNISGWSPWGGRP